MATLYITDLDATLLNAKAQLSDFTRDTINALTAKGMLFSFATARSDETALAVTKGLCLSAPIVVYTGAFLVDSKNRRKIVSHYMSEKEIEAVKNAVEKFSQIPIVYAVVDGKERFIYDKSVVSQSVGKFVKTREKSNSGRSLSVNGGFEGMLKGDIFYFTFMEPKEIIEPVYEYLKGKCNCLFQPDNYTDNWFLEVMSEKATKANAAEELKKLLGADRIVAFGDGLNDIKLFELADECYAVANAEEELKAAATGVIDSCDDDAVARWLLENIK
ncbi:MAG: HAD hydrolase family protein [Ruminococcus sp.]